MTKVSRKTDLFLLRMENLFGRKIIYTSVAKVDEDNVVEVVKKLNEQNLKNVSEMEYLYNYFRGKQDILDRQKTFNDYINNRITNNIAKSIVDFKTAYLVGDAIKYSSNDQENADGVDQLNDYCRLEGKETIDYDLVEWMNIVGTSYRLILPKNEVVEEDESPFYIATLDPRQTLVAYTTQIPHKPKVVFYKTVDQTEEETITTYSVYADGKYFRIANDALVETQEYTLRTLPIIEYPKGKARIGAFESVIRLLNAINTLDSNRLDGVEQAIQSLLVLVNCKMPENMNASAIREMGLVELVSNESLKADIKQISTNLDQSNTQTLKEDLLQAVRTIVCMPNTNQGGYGGDNGLAVVYRNGWEGAYESAMTDQKNMDIAEYASIRLMLEICERVGSLDVPMKAINIDYTRQHYENLATKSQVLISMLNNDKIHPKVAYEASGLFYDPNKKYLEGMEWLNDHQGTQTTEIRSDSQLGNEDSGNEPRTEEPYTGAATEEER